VTWPTSVYVPQLSSELRRDAWLRYLDARLRLFTTAAAGTEQLTRIQNGTRQIRFILEEVLELARAQEERITQNAEDMCVSRYRVDRLTLGRLVRSLESLREPPSVCPKDALVDL
jgi:hypothetical protein